MTNTARTRNAQIKTIARERKLAGISKEAKLAIKIIAIVLIGIFVIIGLEAYTATLKHDNIVLSEENAYIQANIDSLKSQIIEETKVTKIEKTATEKYGMVYPTAENCIIIKDSKSVSNKKLASTIKRKAYN